VDADPAVAHDSLSSELIFNSYEGLIAYDGEKTYAFVPMLATNIPTRADHFLTVTNVSAVGEDPTGSTWIDPGPVTYTCVGYVDEASDGFNAGDALYLTDGTTWRTYQVLTLVGTSTLTMAVWYGSYTFLLRSANTTINFYDHTGAVADTFDVADAEYSFEHALVLDPPGQPIWMFDKPLFDLMDHTYFTNDTAMNLAHLIDDAIVGNADTLTINVGIPFPDTLFKQTLASTWGSIISKENVVAGGSWDGNLYTTTKYGGPYPDWWIDWANQGSGIDYATQDPLDAMVPESFYGTGPYHVEVIDPVGLRVILQKNPSYWRGWPATGSNSSIDTWMVNYYSNWTTMKAAILSHEVDTYYVPRSNMFELLDNVTKQAVDRSIKTIVQIIPVLNLNSVQFTFNVDNMSSYIGSGRFPDGIPTDFFNNSHTRKAFAYSFNWSHYQESLFGEADYRKNWLVLGLYPDSYNESAAPGYFESLANAEAELKAAIFNGTSVWDSGFELSLVYDEGNDDTRIACSSIRDFFQTLSTYDGRTGSPPFVVNLWEISLTELVRGMTHHLLPIYPIGWQAGFADADYFARSYMHSEGSLAVAQGYTADNGWGSLKDTLVDTALLTPDGSPRRALYDQLAALYYNDCPSFPVTVMRGRMWMQYWVKGWYYNAMYPSLYYYPIWKADDCWYDNSGPIAGVSDGVTSMRDIAYLIAHFNAKAPLPGLPVDPKWVRVYGANGCVDPEGNRVCGMRSIAGAIQHFQHHANTNTP
jgi:peptide/nickel transport system substrate-binding protein